MIPLAVCVSNYLIVLSLMLELDNAYSNDRRRESPLKGESGRERRGRGGGGGRAGVEWGSLNGVSRFWGLQRWACWWFHIDRNHNWRWQWKYKNMTDSMVLKILQKIFQCDQQLAVNCYDISIRYSIVPIGHHTQANGQPSIHSLSQLLC